jgi:hypothetical protein
LRKIIILIFIFLNLFYIYSLETVFDNVKWQKISEVDGITLFIQENQNSKATFYKASKIINNAKINDIYNTLMDFDNYPEVFPKIIKFEKKSIINPDKFIIYSIVDFTPLKNRDYYVELTSNKITSENKTTFIIEWHPAQTLFPENIKYKRVLNINGRWTIKEGNDNNLIVSVEYFNDFEVSVLKSLIQNFEKKSTINAVKDLLKDSF